LSDALSRSTGSPLPSVAARHAVHLANDGEAADEADRHRQAERREQCPEQRAMNVRPIIEQSAKKQAVPGRELHRAHQKLFRVARPIPMQRSRRPIMRGALFVRPSAQVAGQPMTLPVDEQDGGLISMGPLGAASHGLDQRGNAAGGVVLLEVALPELERPGEVGEQHPVNPHVKVQQDRQGAGEYQRQVQHEEAAAGGTPAQRSTARHRPGSHGIRPRSVVIHREVSGRPPRSYVVRPIVTPYTLDPAQSTKLTSSASRVRR
jgi:hypothetical protein